MRVVLATFMLATSLTAMSQEACRGLKNPVNFTSTGGAQSTRWTGYTGSKDARESTCSVLGMTYDFDNPIAAADLATQSSGSSCSSPSGGVSADINGTPDQMRRFVIKGAGMDGLTYNRLSYLPPDSSFTSSIRLGNHCGGTHEAEMLTYEFTVSKDNALLTIWYALSLQNGQHPTKDNPEFVIQIEENIGTATSPVWQRIGGDTLCYTRATPAGSGADVSPFFVGSSGVHDQGATYGANIYLPWNKVVVNVYNYLYHKLRIKIAAGDCSMSAHYGYCYIAGECAPFELDAGGCAAGLQTRVSTIAAPKGLMAYKWYKSRIGSSATDDMRNYDLIDGANDSILDVEAEHFTLADGTVTDENKFMCRMTSAMNPNIPFESYLTTTVKNRKPTIIVDSSMSCDGAVRLIDRSISLKPDTPLDEVDTMHTRWAYYSSTRAIGDPDTVIIGPRATYSYGSRGAHCVSVRITTFDTTCWNEKVIPVRALGIPNPVINIPRNNLCKHDEILLSDRTTPTSSWRRWSVHYPDGRVDTSYVSGAGFVYTYDTTVNVQLLTRNGDYYLKDTNADGIADQIWCENSVFEEIRVGEYPTPTLTGDTLVCFGTRAELTASSNLNDSEVAWYRSYLGTTPFVTGETMTDQPAANVRYYAKITSPYGCESWDSIGIVMVDPKIFANKTQMCEGEKLTVYGIDAARFTWSAMPDDPSLIGQENNDTIIVSPSKTTTYTMLGHGTNGCTASPLTASIRIHPYPIPKFEMSPYFIDSEEPTVLFKDVSPNSTSSEWDFGDGNPVHQRQVEHLFTDLSQDSIEISLRTFNALECYNDTSFWVPVSLFAVWFPNAFTPDETSNRTFKLFTHNDLEYFSIYIYSRDGSLVFSSTDQNFEWDGTYRGHSCPEGVYPFVSSYRRPGTVDIVTRRGSVVIVR